MSIRVSVAIALPGRQEVFELELDEGSTLADALLAARVAERIAGWSADDAAVGIWSRRRDPRTVLRDGDRVEVYRPLVADPKQMRRARVRAGRAGSGHKGRRT